MSRHKPAVALAGIVALCGLEPSDAAPLALLAFVYAGALLALVWGLSDTFTEGR